MATQIGGFGEKSSSNTDNNPRDVKAKNWIQGAVSHPGATTAAAQREGLSVHEWATKHASDPGIVGRRARLALTFEGMARSKTVKKAKRASKRPAVVS